MPLHGWPMKLMLLIAVAGCLLAGGCSSSRPAPVAISGMEAYDLIQAGGDLRVLDARTPEDMEKSRIAGSRYFDTTAWYDRLDDPATSFEHPESWAGEFEKLGIGPDTRVLILDAGNPERPGRGAGVWYMLQRLGFDNASFVNGGFPAVEKTRARIGRGSPALADGPQPPEEARALAGPAFIPTGRAVFGGSENKEQVRGLVGSRDIKLIDARSADEYTGVRVYEGNPRGGHIPGSVLITHRDVFGPDAGFRPREEIRARLKAAGLKPGDTIITYCQGGGRSAALAAAMIYAGYDNIANYFGSFGEWSKDEACPVVTGPAAVSMKP